MTVHIIVLHNSTEQLENIRQNMRPSLQFQDCVNPLGCTNIDI